jgi:hypothetical protein
MPVTSRVDPLVLQASYRVHSQRLSAVVIGVRLDALQHLVLEVARVVGIEDDCGLVVRFQTAVGEVRGPDPCGRLTPVVRT